MYEQIFDPVGNSLGLSSIFAALPLLTIFVLLGALKMKAQWAGLISLAVALGVAILVYDMPTGQALSTAAEGASFGIFPIMWIVINAIWIYNMTVVTGHFDVLRRSFGTISDDQRIQAIIIAFCFGGLLEALAGFGTPVAISSVMLIALGFKPIKAATVALVANTAPVAFGAIAVPITTLATVTGLPVADLGGTVGRQTPILALLVPLALVFMVDGKRGVRQTWPAAIAGGLAFAIGQFVCSNYLSVELTDIVASLVGAAAIVALLRVWKPTEELTAERMSDEEVSSRISGATATAHAVETGGSRRQGASVNTGHGDPSGTKPTVGGNVPTGGTGAAGVGAGAAGAAAAHHDSGSDIFKAYSPYLIIIAVFSVAQLGFIKDLLAKGVVKFAWPGLNVVTPSGSAPSAATFNFNWLPSGGTLLLICGFITMAVLGVGPGRALKSYLHTLDQLKWAILTLSLIHI